MNVKLLDHTENPIETIYRAFKICYSNCIPTEIKIPLIETSIGDVIDTQNMVDFIKKHISHESPIEHCSFTFAVEGYSRITEQQLTRHRVASYSIQSGRYVNKTNSQIAIPSTIQNNHQALIQFIDTEQMINHTYNKLIEMGIPKEDARYIMPQGQTTNMIFTMNLREIRHFLSERLCIKAQWEIRNLANQCLNLIIPIVPFVDYKLEHCDECTNCLVKKKD